MHSEKHDKSEEKPQGQCSNLFNLSSHCRRSYKTFSAVPWLFDCSYFVLCYFMLTPSKCCARNSPCKESWYQVFFAWPHPSLLAYHWSHNTLIPVSWEWSCFFVLVHGKERCSAPELHFVVYCGMKIYMAHWLKFSIAATPPKVYNSATWVQCKVFCD